MACATCGSTIIFGGLKADGKRYCNEKCYASVEMEKFVEDIPAHEVEEFANQIYSGLCPSCNGLGPIDVHESFQVYSLIIVTNWKTNEHLSCKSCARKMQWKDLFISFFFGWWGFPFGFILAPVQVIKNVISMNKYPGELMPSERLKEVAGFIMVDKIIQSQHEENEKSQFVQ